MRAAHGLGKQRTEQAGRAALRTSSRGNSLRASYWSITGTTSLFMKRITLSRIASTSFPCSSADFVLLRLT